MSDTAGSFDLERVRRDTFVRSIDYHASLDSTNDRAVELIAQGQADYPALVLTVRQTRGRGRGTNHWWSTDGSLTFSVVVDAHELRFPVGKLPMVSLATGLAVCSALTPCLTAPELALKWPNDVYLRGRKLCGILAEVPSSTAGKVVIGIGINVNNSFAGAPEDVRVRATSLHDVLGRTTDLNGVLIETLRQLDVHLRTLARNPETIRSRWSEYCLLTGRAVCLQIGPREEMGICRGIDEEGAIVLEQGEGRARFLTGVVARFD